MVICEFCGKEIRKNYLRTHWKLCKNILEKCPTCDKGFLSKYLLQQHIDINHLKLKDFICDRCGNEFATQRRLNDHIRRVHTEGNLDSKTFICKYDQCDKEFPRKRLLQYHINKVHRDPKPGPIYECDLCNRVFKTKKGLRDHMVHHGDTKPFPCQFCGKRFYGKSHEKIHTHPFKCDVCNERFINEEEKNDHTCKKQIHFKPKFSPTGLLECDVCGLTFHKKVALNNHILRVHTDKLQCLSCRGLFRTEMERLTHHCTGSQTVHNCDFCGQSFEKKFTMHVHRKLHTHKFKCQVCSKRYIDETALKTHLCVKKGQKPKATKQSMAINKCKICKIDFQLHHEYLMHKKQHEIYECPDCPRRFASKKILWSHRDYMHKKRVLMSKKHEQLATTGSSDIATADDKITPPSNDMIVTKGPANHFENNPVTASGSGMPVSSSDIPYMIPQQVVPMSVTNYETAFNSASYFSL